MTSTSASLQATAIASLPLISASFSCCAFSTTLAICVLAPRAGFADVGDHFLRNCLAAGAGIDDAVLHHRVDLLLVLSADPKSVRSLRLVLDLLLQPGLVSRFVLLPHLPLAGVVGERGLVDHRDAVRHGAHRLAHPTPTARFHVRIIVC